MRALDFAAWIVAASTVLAGCSSSSDGDADPHQRCEQLRDHLIDLRLGATTEPNTEPAEPTKPGAEPRPPIQPIDFASHRRAMQQALGERFVGTCVTHMSATQVSCVLAAKDQAAADACSPPNPTPAPPIAARTASK